MEQRQPLPPFTRETAIQKVRLAEDGWNGRNPEAVSKAYTVNTKWRNRATFVNGRDEVVAFLADKWAKELDYRLVKELWAFTDNRISVRYAYEYHHADGNWFRAYGKVVSRMWWKLASSALRACNVGSGQAARSRDIGTRG